MRLCIDHKLTKVYVTKQIYQFNIRFNEIVLDFHIKRNYFACVSLINLNRGDLI